MAGQGRTHVSMRQTAGPTSSAWFCSRRHGVLRWSGPVWAGPGPEGSPSIFTGQYICVDSKCMRSSTPGPDPGRGQVTLELEALGGQQQTTWTNKFIT